MGLRVAGLLNERYTVFGMVRRPEHGEALRAFGVTPIVADLDVPESLWRIGRLARDILHLAPPPAQGQEDTRTRHLVAALGRARSLVYVSTSGVYGDCQGAIIDETRPPNPQSERAHRRLDAERTLRAWGLRTRTRVAILRVPGIYASDRLPRVRLAARDPALRREEDVYTNHIHADDLALIVRAALWRAAPQRIYHACDDSSLLMADYLDLVAERLGYARPPRIERSALEAGLSALQYSFLRESRRLHNGRLKAELSVVLRYPRVEDGLAAVRDGAVMASEPLPRQA
ncbi:MAG: sugar nucleotide-binding protein [Burkholderiaceae bacterium]